MIVMHLATHEGSADPFVDLLLLTIGCITRIIDKLTLLLTGGASFRGSIRLEHVSAMLTFPLCHGKALRAGPPTADVGTSIPSLGMRPAPFQVLFI
jgi:hypothetical protein